MMGKRSGDMFDDGNGRGIDKEITNVETLQAVVEVLESKLAKVKNAPLAYAVVNEAGEIIDVELKITNLRVYKDGEKAITIRLLKEVKG